MIQLLGNKKKPACAGLLFCVSVAVYDFGIDYVDPTGVAEDRIIAALCSSFRFVKGLLPQPGEMTLRLSWCEVFFRHHCAAGRSP